MYCRYLPINSGPTSPFRQLANEDEILKKGENMNTLIEKSSVVIATAIILGLIALSAVVYLQSQRIIKNQAIDGCYHTATIQFKDGDKTISTPENYWSELCMEKKGYTK